MLRRFIAALSVFMALAWHVPASAQTALQAPSIKWQGQWGTTQPVSFIGYDTGTGLPCIIGATATCAAGGTAPAPVSVTSTNLSGTVTTGGTFQVLSAASTTRAGCFIQNPITATETLFVFFGANGSALTTKAVNLAPGSAVGCATQGGGILGDNISVTAATTGHAFVAQVQ